jgi:dolichyl-phosphate beta-glucosyltransferase
MHKKKIVSVVIPTYYEANRLPPTLVKLSNSLSDSEYFFNVIIVDDNSQDGTINIAKLAVSDIKCENVKFHFITNSKRQGKGQSIKIGFDFLNADYYIMYDADSSTPAKYILIGLGVFSDQGIDAVLGSRVVNTNSSLSRRILSLISLTLSHLIVFKSPVNDSQCGFKILSHKCYKKISDKLTIKSGMIDVEIIHLIHLSNLNIFYQSVDWLNDEDTRINMKLSLFNYLFDLFKIRRRHNGK